MSITQEKKIPNYTSYFGKELRFLTTAPLSFPFFDIKLSVKLAVTNNF